MGCRVTHDVEEAIRDADIINLLRNPARAAAQDHVPEPGRVRQLFGLNKARLARTKPDALIMHPGPINGEWKSTATSRTASGHWSCSRFTNGLAVRMAALFLVNGGQGPSELPRL
jgi:aspartate carbamoyltransferase catalytic subunit